MTTKDINLKGTAITPLSGDRSQLRLQMDGLRRADELHRRIRRHDPAARARHARLVQPRRHLQLHGGDRPGFQTSYVDEAPASNADLGKTIFSLLKLDPPGHGKLVGRVLTEAMPGGMTPDFTSRTRSSKPDDKGLRTILRYQTVGDTKYFDAAGFLGRTVGLE